MHLVPFFYGGGKTSKMIGPSHNQAKLRMGVPIQAEDTSLHFEVLLLVYSHEEVK